MSFLRFLMFMSLVVWIGGIIWFAFVMAPTLFTVLPTAKLAGDVVSVSLTKLHWIGLASGLIFLLSSLIYDQLNHNRLKLFSLSHIFVLLMLVLTAISQFAITPRMRELRAGLPSTLTPSSTDPNRIEFDDLHAWSTRLEGGVLLLGLGVVFLTARRFESSK